jgi:hypothetical protein
VVITGWSRGAIATGAIGLYDDATSKLFRAFVPVSERFQTPLPVRIH